MRTARFQNIDKPSILGESGFIGFTRFNIGDMSFASRYLAPFKKCGFRACKKRKKLPYYGYSSMINQTTSAIILSTK